MSATARRTDWLECAAADCRMTFGTSLPGRSKAEQRFAAEPHGWTSYPTEHGRADYCPAHS